MYLLVPYFLPTHFVFNNISYPPSFLSIENDFTIVCQPREKKLELAFLQEEGPLFTLWLSVVVVYEQLC